jgi:protein-disulfide isomerase
LPQIVSEYIAKGKVKLVYRDFPLSFHKDSRSSSLAANCAGEQGGDKVYFKYHDKLYENQTSLGTESYKKWAAELGLKADQFSKCLDSEKYASEVDKDFQDGASYGVSGTPAFFINGRKIVGAQPFAAFKTIIDDELSKVK